MTDYMRGPVLTFTSHCSRPVWFKTTADMDDVRQLTVYIVHLSHHKDHAVEQDGSTLASCSSDRGSIPSQDEKFMSDP